MDLPKIVFKRSAQTVALRLMMEIGNCEFESCHWLQYIV